MPHPKSSPGVRPAECRPSRCIIHCSRDHRHAGTGRLRATRSRKYGPTSRPAGFHQQYLLPAHRRGGAEEVDIEETLRWQITATGHGVETDRGTQPLDEAWREFEPRGIDGRAGMIWGTGPGGWLASLAAGQLHPRPPGRRSRTAHPGPHNAPRAPPGLATDLRSPSQFPYTGAPHSFRGISDRLERAGQAAGAPQALRTAIDAFQEGRTGGPNINQPLPPTQILINTADAAQAEAQCFLDAIRRASPEGAITDQLISCGGSGASSATMQQESTLPSNIGAKRYSHLALNDTTLTASLLQGRSPMMTNTPPAPFAPRPSLEASVRPHRVIESNILSTARQSSAIRSNSGSGGPAFPGHSKASPAIFGPLAAANLIISLSTIPMAPNRPTQKRLSRTQAEPGPRRSTWADSSHRRSRNPGITSRTRVADPLPNPVGPEMLSSQLSFGPGSADESSSLRIPNGRD
ncbi:hypothetical protein V8E36_004236 [Tilletia maclaganii]